jgi:hypothetical protein
MLAQRTLIRTAQRLPSRSAPLRSTKRTYATQTTGSGSSGFKPQDNAFNRERDAVKAHAAASSGECPSPSVGVSLSLSVLWRSVC